MLTNSVLYIRDKNSTVTLPEGSQKLKTEMTYADFISDWKTSWFAMNDMIANQTGGKLNDQLVPKGKVWCRFITEHLNIGLTCYLFIYAK